MVAVEVVGDNGAGGRGSGFRVKGAGLASVIGLRVDKR